MDLPFGLTALQGLWLAAGLLGAAFVRGYSGFGFSAIFIAYAALFTNPVPLIPAIFLCEILMTLFMLRGIGASVDWRRVVALWAGALVAIVPSVWVMARLDGDTARLIVAGLIFALALFLLSGWQLARVLPLRGYGLVGGISGMVNAAGVGGLPVAAFMTAQPMAPAVFRAVLIVYIVGLDLISLPVMGMNGLVSYETFVGAGLALPMLSVGIATGTRRFGHASPQAFRRFAIILLALLAGISLVKALF